MSETGCTCGADDPASARRGYGHLDWCPVANVPTEAVNHPTHYGGESNVYEAIKVIDAWDLGFCLGNAVKYICRAGKKDDSVLQDLRKAQWYLQHEIERLSSTTGT